MPAAVSREIHLASRPEGMPGPENFTLVEKPIDAPGAGEILVRNLFMSVDPYMRGRMIDRKSYVPPFKVGEVLDGGAVGEVVASGDDRFQPGDLVQHRKGWREYALARREELTALPPDTGLPPQAFLGVLGMPGLTAYAGLLRIGELKEGETVFVSAASGAVGSIVCQIARIRNCAVVGSAGSDEKCAWLEQEAGVGKAINYKSCVGDLTAAVTAACPKGIDVYFENVGGAHLEAAIENMRPFGRIVMCGMIAQYNATRPEPGPRNLVQVVGKQLKMQGFIVSSHTDMLHAFQHDMVQWITAGRMKWQETIVDGIEQAPVP
jgi:NADPH-dependent curcumin reductase CurA